MPIDSQMLFQVTWTSITDKTDENLMAMCSRELFRYLHAWSYSCWLMLLIKLLMNLLMMPFSQCILIQALANASNQSLCSHPQWLDSTRCNCDFSLSQSRLQWALSYMAERRKSETNVQKTDHDCKVLPWMSPSWIWGIETELFSLSLVKMLPRTISW